MVSLGNKTGLLPKTLPKIQYILQTFETLIEHSEYIILSGVKAVQYYSKCT